MVPYMLHVNNQVVIWMSLNGFWKAEPRGVIHFYALGQNGKLTETSPGKLQEIIIYYQGARSLFCIFCARIHIFQGQWENLQSLSTEMFTLSDLVGISSELYYF